MITINNRLFNAIWRRLAEQGKCDGFGGCEYTRVRSEWEALGCPKQIADFIAIYANIGSKGRERLN
jgi:hypothetical protein